ncbi:GNAT family N-acetyltransferase [Dehalobacter sp. DCM]|uniref:GNAT family N-acetyltransferase n=1 Tax=Dehalobacter sp. DCM TaxID=2907827 RepID=UPI003081B407|nr:GNAT family N-acetyltransferase [Dehalobacter sp. DCM]
MLPNYLIRKANYADIQDLSHLLSDLFSIENDFTPNDVLQKRGLEMLLQDPENRCIYVAELNHRIIGMVTCQILISTAEGGPSALIEDLIVEKEQRGNGLGKRLLDRIEQWAAEKGARRFQLLADKNNTPALDFYKKNSWHGTQLICLRKNQNL